MPPTEKGATIAVDDEVFRRVYDSPKSLSGKHRWLTATEHVREIEKVLGMPAGTIPAPLWVSGDTKTCGNCNGEMNWLDIVSSGVAGVHSPAMIAAVILGER